MTILGRPPRHRQDRRLLWAALLAAGLAGLTVPLAAQEPPPGKEPPPKKSPLPPEEEEPGGTQKPLKKVPVEGDPAPPKNPEPAPPMTPTPGNPPQTGGQPAPAETEGVYVAKLDDVARAAAAAANPTVKKYLSGFTVAFDRLSDSRFRTFEVTPLPLLWGKDKFPDEFGVAPIGPDGVPGDVSTVKRREVRDVQPFELIAVERTTDFLKPTHGPDAPRPADKLAAAERVLTAVLFFHDAARDQNRRRGKSWDPVKLAVYDKLTEVRMERLRQVAADKDWPKLRELTGRLAELYKNNPKVLEQVLAARLAEAEVLVKSDNLPDLERGRELLSEYESRFPNTKNETAQRVHKTLADRADKFRAEVEKLKQSNPTQARNLLKTVQAIDPNSDATRRLENTVKSGYPTLIVGTRRLPELMSPARARFDSERQAVELMFEGLLEAIPDEQVGVRFRPALAAGRPAVGAGVRDVELVRSAQFPTWDGPRPFDATNVEGTLNLSRRKPWLTGAEAVDWFDDPRFDPGDPGRIRLRFKVGHPDPRQPLTMKVYPAQWLLEKNKQLDDLEFARRPFGTGPFRLAPNHRPPKPGEPPRDVVFLANPSYASRPGRMAQPLIKEVRFTDATQYPDLPGEFRGDRLHVLTDVPTTELSRYTADNGLGGRVRVVTAAQNRRVHILAVNHRRPHLQSPDVRRGISLAIDRERILNEVYRGGRPEFHKAMTGPYPPGSWATPRAVGGGSLYNRDVAQARFRQYLGDPAAAPVVSLLCPDDDPQARAACDKMKGMIESASAADDRKLTVNVEAVPPRELWRRVEELQNYDLAYLPFDYPDDWYPLGLGSFLDPNATGPLGRNYLGYLSKESRPGEPDERLAGVLAECRVHRDFDKLTALAHEAHRRFNDTVPFVPLWQLDRHTVIATGVKVYLDGQVEEANPRLLNPTRLFSSVGRWRVE